MTAPLKAKFDAKISGELAKALNKKSALNAPRLVKVALNIGIGSRITSGNKDYSFIEENLISIAGQKPNVRKARMSVSNFKLREGMPVGLSVTLRGRLMYDFVERLVNVALPRVRDFQGITVKGFDGKGNFCLGIKDVTIFPEINHENLSQAHGLQINVCTTAETDHEAYMLLKALGFPFKGEVSAKESNK
ncbi:50S ribosomal protein L5 [Candidatus Peregrinibacteria bacterium]|jgi:large subunit ribosomal protein L5|nr:50S ribosomal protein L5 [Candidatus Peregrinibacteria bacterium]MBT4631633.1 50S ribosomal protein L5 [Candidatus Peregrinibacteria bacterium]MBT5516761.1 50S ribosomal protein L5 [Candidatus Peregrinibacteria bacterium]MBT5823957.1 50S ribosomal protein L5 [Candidatus Peregrinibacteria bacterium]